MDININSSLSNIWQSYLGHEIMDSILYNSKGITLDSDQLTVIADIFDGVDTFRIAFEANGWRLQSMRIPLQVYFILSDLVFFYDEKVARLHRVSLLMRELSKEIVAVNIPTNIWSLRWMMLCNQFNSIRNDIRFQASAIFDLLSEIHRGNIDDFVLI